MKFRWFKIYGNTGYKGNESEKNQQIGWKWYSDLEFGIAVRQKFVSKCGDPEDDQSHKSGDGKHGKNAHEDDPPMITTVVIDNHDGR